MKKCPSCGAPTSTLVRFCERCGSEVPASASSVANSEPVVADNSNKASELSAETQEILAQLLARSPVSGPAAFLIGLLSVPTLGLAFLLFRTFRIFGSVGRSDNRLLLSIDQNLRSLELSYKADPGVRELIAKANQEREAYMQRKQASARAFWFGLGISLVLTVVVFLALASYAGSQRQKAAQAAIALLAQQQQADAAARQQAAVDSANQARQDHATSVQLTSAVKGNVAYKAVILVENFSEIGNNNVPIFENLLGSKIAGFGFAIVDQDSVARAISSHLPPGPSLAGAAANAVSNILSVSETAVGFARELNANFIIHAAINSYGHESSKFTGYGVTTDNIKYTLQISYKLIETGEGGAVKGGTVEASKIIRNTEGSQVESTDLLNGLLEDAASQIAQVINQIRPNPQAP